MGNSLLSLAQVRSCAGCVHFERCRVAEAVTRIAEYPHLDSDELTAAALWEIVARHCLNFVKDDEEGGQAA